MMTSRATLSISSTYSETSGSPASPTSPPKNCGSHTPHASASVSLPSSQAQDASPTSFSATNDSWPNVEDGRDHLNCSEWYAKCARLDHEQLRREYLTVAPDERMVDEELIGRGQIRLPNTPHAVDGTQPAPCEATGRR